jgi:hypothetical protein
VLWWEAAVGYPTGVFAGSTAWGAASECPLIPLGANIRQTIDPNIGRHSQCRHWSGLPIRAVILHNVVDMSRILAQPKAGGIQRAGRRSELPESASDWLHQALRRLHREHGQAAGAMAGRSSPPRKGPNRSPNQGVLPLSGKSKPRGIATSDAVLLWRKSLWWIFTLISAGDRIVRRD